MALRHPVVRSVALEEDVGVPGTGVLDGGLSVLLLPEVDDVRGLVHQQHPVPAPVQGPDVSDSCQLP